MSLSEESPIVYEKLLITQKLSEYLDIDGELIILSEDGVNPDLRYNIQQQFPYSMRYTVFTCDHMKTLENMEEVVKFMYHNGCRTKTMILILGGTQLKELGGFIARSYCCGIPYVYIPVGRDAQNNCRTSFCGMDLHDFSNVLGCNYAPAMIFLDSSLSYDD